MFHNSKGRIISSIGLTLGLVLLLAAAACGESTPTPTATPPPIAAAVTPTATPLPPIAATAAPTATPVPAGRSYRHPERYPYLDRYATTASGANRNTDPVAIANQGSGASTSNTRCGAYVHTARCADSAYTDPIGYARSHFNTDATDADSHTHAKPLRLCRRARPELVDPRSAAGAYSQLYCISVSIAGELDT